MNNVYKDRVPFNFILTTSIRNGRNVFHNNFGGFRFSGARFARDHNAGVTITLFNRSVGSVGNGEYVRCIFEQFSTCGKDSKGLKKLYPLQFYLILVLSI